MSFTKILQKRDGKIFLPKNDKVRLKVLAFNRYEDWVIFQRTDSEEFQNAAVLCEEEDLPDENCEHNEKVTVRYYNAGLFSKKLKQLHRTTELIMYQDCDDVEATADVEDEAEIVIADGAVSGVCGAPYYFKDKVVAFHVESDNESLKFTERVQTKKMLKSLSTTYSHFSVGRVLCRLPAFMKLYRRNYEIETVETGLREASPPTLSPAASTKATSTAVKKPTKASEKDATTVRNKTKIEALTPGAAAEKKRRRSGNA